MKKRFSLVLYYFVIIMYLEICYKYFVYHNIWNINLLYIILFSCMISLILTFFTRLASPKINKKITIFFVSLLTIFFISNYIYYNIFSVPFTIQVTKMAGQALDFFPVLFKILWNNLLPLIIFSLPLVLTLWKKSKITIKKIFYFEKKSLIKLIIINYLVIVLILIPFKNKDFSAYKLYWLQNNLSNSIQTFGLLTADRLDIQRTLLGFEEKIELSNNKGFEEKEQKYNKLEIDFEKLINQTTDSQIKTVYSYFENESPTNQNEYTGIYKGKNLIFILAESFNQIAVSKELTPTLYRLIHTGFQFNNFYSPVFLSTTGGEFQAMTGLVPNADTLSEWYKGKVSLPMSLGNSLGDIGYQTHAFHNYEATFYDRIKTMPTLGFSNYFACLTGLEKEMECNWTDSNAPDDEEMMKVTYSKYSKEKPFVSYYITMSGHFPYGLTSKTRNYQKVKDLPFDEQIKGYLSTQIDLDQALEYLIKQLEKDGILDDTVICLVGDHYPYALSLDQINDLSTYERDEKFETQHSSFIIWNNNSNTIEVNKVASQIDILPTLLNLFGIEYDSRLMIGHDIFSKKEGLAIFSDMSWISDSGKYSVDTKTFTPKKEVTDNYVTEMNRWVNNSSIVSKKIITENLYQKIFESIGDK